MPQCRSYLTGGFAGPFVSQTKEVPWSKQSQTKIVDSSNGSAAESNFTESLDEFYHLVRPLVCSRTFGTGSLRTLWTKQMKHYQRHKREDCVSNDETKYLAVFTRESEEEISSNSVWVTSKSTVAEMNKMAETSARWQSQNFLTVNNSVEGYNILHGSFCLIPFLPNTSYANAQQNSVNAVPSVRTF